MALGGGYTSNKDTVFIVKDKDDDITVYTGIKNVPDINVGTTGTAGYVYAMKDKNNANKAASLVFVDAGSNGSVKNASKDSLIYLLKLDSTSVDNTNNEDVYTWKVVMDGEETSIKTKEDWKTDYTGNSIFLLEDYSINSDGYYEGGDAYDTTDADKFADTLSGATISQSGDTMTFKDSSVDRTVVVNDDTKIVLVMSPTAKSSVTTDVLRREIMTDWAADYELGLGMTAKGVANLLKGYDVTGTAYVTYDDKDKSDVAVNIYVVVTAAAVHADP